MSGLYLGIGRASITDPLVFKQLEAVEGYLIDLAGEACNPRSSRQFIKAANPIFGAKKLDVHCLHYATSGRDEYIIAAGDCRQIGESLPRVTCPPVVFQGYNWFP